MCNCYCYCYCYLQGGDGVLLQMPLLLEALFAHREEYISAAAKANVTPGLFHALRKISAARESRAASGTPFHPLVIRPPIRCLRALLESEVRDDMGLPRLANEAGMIPVFGELLRLGDKRAIGDLVSMAGLVLLTLPVEDTSTVARGYMRALSGLIPAEPAVAQRAALDGLFALGVARRELIEDFPAWGLGDTLQRLTQHDKRRTAAAAKRVLFLVNDGREVRLMLFHPSSIYDLLYRCWALTFASPSTQMPCLVLKVICSHVPECAYV
jgi:hypothetical protein